MRLSQSKQLQQVVAIALTVLIVVGFFFWIAEFTSSRSGNAAQDLVQSANIGDAPQRSRNASNPEPAEVPIAMLSDYYEHGIEHAPPRDPSGVMQRRERYYRAPNNPIVLLDLKLRSYAPDNDLRLELEKWLREWRRGRTLDAQSLRHVADLAASSSLSSLTMMEAGRAFQFLEGDAFAAVWFDAALAKATREYASSSAGDPAAVPLLHEMDEMKALWRMNDFRGMEMRFSLAMALNAPWSPESRRAGYLHAEMLYLQRNYVAAATAMDAVQALNLKVGDLGTLDQSDLQEMEWVLGLMQYFGGSKQMARRHFARCSAAKGDHTQSAYQMLIVIDTDFGDGARAINELRAYASRYGRSDVAAALATRIKEAGLVSSKR